MNNIMSVEDASVHNVWSWKVDQYYDLVSSLDSPNVLPIVNCLVV